MRERCVSCKGETFQNPTKSMTRLLTVFLLSITLAACEQKKQSLDKDKERLDKVCDAFMESFSKGQFKEAVGLLKQNSVLESEKLDTLLVTFENHSHNVFPAYGKMLFGEFINERKIKDFIAKRFYILKFDKYPVKFDFTLYKGANGWTITSFNYNDDLMELLY
jgi:hypothetical protein